MGMDRKSHNWPGPTTPPAPYPHEYTGGTYPPHEVGQHTRETRQHILANVIAAPGLPSDCNVSLWMSVPDARLMAVLTIAFEPDVVPALGSMAASTIHLASTEDLGGTPSPVEDLIGTAAVPAQLIQAGLRGFQYSPTEEVEGMLATLYLGAPIATGGNTGTGKWIARARWQALRPMTEIEWRDAVPKMVLLPQGAVVPITLNIAVPG